MFVRAADRKQRAAIKRRYECVEVTGPLQRGGRPFTPAEKLARKEAGVGGPRGPGVEVGQVDMRVAAFALEKIYMTQLTPDSSQLARLVFSWTSPKLTRTP